MPTGDDVFAEILRRHCLVQDLQVRTCSNGGVSTSHLGTHIRCSVPASAARHLCHRKAFTLGKFLGPILACWVILDHSSEGLGLATKIDDGARICIAAGTGSVHSAIHFHDRWLDRQCRN